MQSKDAASAVKWSGIIFANFRLDSRRELSVFQWRYVQQVMEFAEETLPLNEIASGPSDSPGLGPEFQHHSALDFVLQELRRFPGKGWRLIQTGMQSPTVRNRNNAVQALARWDRTSWPADAEALLRRAIEAEPNDQTRAIMGKVLAGEFLEAN